MLAISIWIQTLIGALVGAVAAVVFGVLKVKYGPNGRGIRLLNEGKFAEAEQMFSELIARGKAKSIGHRAALLNRAVARIDGGKPREAMSDLEAADELMPKKSNVMRAAWLFNHAYCQILLNELDDVPAQIDELETLNVRALRAHATRLRILYAARQERFEDAVELAEAEARDGPAETAPRAIRLAHTLHAFVLSQHPDAAARESEVQSLAGKARAIDAPAPTGMNEHWPAWGVFLSERSLG